MKKKYFRKLALWMAVLMILLSVPTNAVVFPSTGATATEHMTATEGITETTLTDPDEEIVESFEWIIGDTASTETGLRSPSNSDSTTSTTSDSQFLTTPTIPEGVYALHSLANEGQWMSVSANQYLSGANLEQCAYSVSPASSFSRAGLFKISRYQDSDVYVIRLMTNNLMGIDVSGSTVKTQEIHKYDSNVDGAGLYTITWDNGGYIIESVLDGFCIAAPSSTESFTSLVSQTPSEAGTRAKWQLQPYTGEDLGGITTVRSGALVAGEQYMIRVAAVWTTLIDVAGARLSVDSQYASIATGTWNSTTSTYTVDLHDEGTFQTTARFDDFNTGKVLYEYKTYTATLPFAEGVYYIKNKALDLYVQIDNDTAPDYSANGAALELFDFDGGDYQRWTVEHAVDGYYKILSLCDKAASIHEDYVNAERHIWQAFYLGDTYYNQQWKITSTGRGSYVIRPRSGEAYSTDWCWAAQDDVVTSNGSNVEQRAYVDDNNYMDEWFFHKHKDYTLMFIGHEEGTPYMPPILNSVNEAMQDDAYMDGYAYTSLNKEDLIVHLASSNVFACITHGEQIALKASDYWLTKFEIDNMLADNAFSNLDFVYMGACLTGAWSANGENMIYAMYNKGAKTVLGFTIEVSAIETYVWTEHFMLSLANGNTVAKAMIDADEGLYNDPTLGGSDNYSVSADYRNIAGPVNVRPCS